MEMVRRLLASCQIDGSRRVAAALVATLRIPREGNAYLIQQFPALDRVVRATIVQED